MVQNAHEGEAVQTSYSETGPSGQGRCSGVRTNDNAGPPTTQRTRGAEEAGFEPAIEIAPYAGLANRCLQPLGHPSSSAATQS